jgi:mono/diheme cytochrome c family protein
VARRRPAAALALLLGPSIAVAAEDDAKLLHEGWRRYHAVCVHCHGPDAVGSSFAPSLIDPAPDRATFLRVVRDGVPGRMTSFGEDPNVAPYVEALFAYLQARASGRLGRGRVGD